MIFRVQILGSGSATPRLHRNPSAQYVNVLERHILIDCAEGTQIQMQKYKVKPQRIQHILISHLHGDHYLGLIGLLSSMHLNSRKKPVHIYAPEGLKEIVNMQLHYSKTTLGFDLIFHPLVGNQPEKIFEDKLIEIWTIPLEHRIYCNGFLIKEKEKPRNISKEAIKKHGIPIAMMHRLAKGEDWVQPDGAILPNEELTINPPAPRSFAYCSDTRYSEKIVDTIQGIDLLYHEATFLNNLKDRAKKTYHSTAEQAARIAKLCGAKQLIIGHFSARYMEVEAFEEEAGATFENVKAVNDGDIYDI
ncbi:ribonuclease Z [Parvicella tangerina]|uniref:Ribonuclease Z n=1 Tax=Parvicella tangerina TaxID=2829795 RepID=A0A916NGH0_9FLAO|nr:ribonuclease Z [Parvicella tangerina]CAG5080522.1 Ribonuclease Z [Parvicella tangerina]